jgi:signal transduction histidine kinase
MTAVDDTRRRAVQLCAQARSARSQARDIKAQTRVLGGATAATEDQIAATIDRLAVQRPSHAERLRAMSESARRYAARARQRLESDPGGEPGAAAIATTPKDDGILPVTGEQDRIATQLQDMVIQRVFAAGLSLQSAAGLTTEPDVCWRIEAAADELDEVVREIRTVIFREVQHRHG